MEEDVTTYQKDVGSYCRRCFHVSEKSWNLMEEDVTTYQGHRDICWKKLLQRIRKILEVSAKRCYNVSERSWKLMQVDVKTGQEHLGSYCKTMLQRVRNILEVNILTLTG